MAAWDSGWPSEVGGDSERDESSRRRRVHWADVSSGPESVYSGSVEMLLRNVPTHECAASLSAKGGIAPRYSDWAMQLWKDILPDFIRDGHQNIQEDRSQRWEGSVEKVLGQKRKSRREGQ